MRPNFKSLATTLTIAPSVAFAEGNADWVKPASSMIDNLNSGLVQIGIPLIGAAIVIAGIMMAFQERPNWVRIGTIIFAGCLVSIGPLVLSSFLEQ